MQQQIIQKLFEKPKKTSESLKNNHEIPTYPEEIIRHYQSQIYKLSKNTLLNN